MNSESSAMYEPINRVLVDGRVVLKIVQHCRQNIPTTVIGNLLGMAVQPGGVLEITDCFALPGRLEEDIEANIDAFSSEMMRCLREVNVDHNMVGWYQSHYLGMHINQFLVDTQYTYQSNIHESVVLIYDPLATSHGSLTLKAYRLSETFKQLYKTKGFTKEKLAEKNFSFQDIFEQVPVELKTSNLEKALLHHLELDEQLTDQYEAFDMATDDFMEKNLDGLLQCVIDLQREQNSHSQWQRNISRLEKEQRDFLQLRKADNISRKEKNLEPLQEGQKELELENPTIFKKPAEPSRLESLLLAQRIMNQCNQISEFGAQSLTKQFLLKSLNDSTKL